MYNYFKNLRKLCFNFNGKVNTGSLEKALAQRKIAAGSFVYLRHFYEFFINFFFPGSQNPWFPSGKILQLVLFFFCPPAGNLKSEVPSVLSEPRHSSLGIGNSQGCPDGRTRTNFHEKFTFFLFFRKAQRAIILVRKEAFSSRKSLSVPRKKRMTSKKFEILPFGSHATPAVVKCITCGESNKPPIQIAENGDTNTLYKEKSLKKVKVSSHCQELATMYVAFTERLSRSPINPK